MSARGGAVGIVGLGLVGGSLARALTRAGWRVVGLDRPAVLRRARAARAITASASDLRDLAARVPLLVLAAPPTANRRLLRRLARHATPGLLVTDVGGVKAGICADARRLGLRFVGGHPMAGRARGGFAAGEADLFVGRTWIFTPLPDARPADLRAVRRLARATGARPRLLDPESHDRAMAFLSHLPQVVAWALAEAARADPVAGPRQRYAGPGFRDMTRLAGSPRPLWRQILRENRAEVAAALRAFLRALRRPV